VLILNAKGPTKIRLCMSLSHLSWTFAAQL